MRLPLHVAPIWTGSMTHYMTCGNLERVAEEPYDRTCMSVDDREQGTQYANREDYDCACVVSVDGCREQAAGHVSREAYD